MMSTGRNTKSGKGQPLFFYKKREMQSTYLEQSDSFQFDLLVKYIIAYLLLYVTWFFLFIFSFFFNFYHFTKTHFLPCTFLVLFVATKSTPLRVPVRENLGPVRLSCLVLNLHCAYLRFAHKFLGLLLIHLLTFYIYYLLYLLTIRLQVYLT